MRAALYSGLGALVLLTAIKLADMANVVLAQESLPASAPSDANVPIEGGPAPVGPVAQDVVVPATRATSTPTVGGSGSAISTSVGILRDEPAKNAGQAPVLLRGTAVDSTVPGLTVRTGDWNVTMQVELKQLQDRDLQAEKKIRSLLVEVPNRRDEGQRDEIVEELRPLLVEQFKARQRRREIEIEQIEARVQTLRDMLKMRAAEEETIIKRRLDEIVNEAAGLGWGDAADPAATTFSSTAPKAKNLQYYYRELNDEASGRYRPYVAPMPTAAPTPIQVPEATNERR